jgi:hypothetical protein
MIDIENEVFTELKTTLEKQFDNISVQGFGKPIPATLPCVTVLEADNYAVTATRDSGSTENHVDVMYEVNVYASSKTSGKKLFAAVDNIFLDMGFTRTTMTQITPDNADIYRIVGRYTARISKDKTIFRR